MAVVPVAIGGAAVADLVLVLLFAVLGTIGLAAIYWALTHARGIAGGVPVAGRVLVSGIDGLRTTVVGLMRWQEDAIVGAVHDLTRRVVQVVALCTRSQFGAVIQANSDLSGVVATAVAQLNDEVWPLARSAAQGVSDLSGVVQTVVRQLDDQVFPRLAAVEKAGSDLSGVVAVAVAQLDDQVFPELGRLQAQAAQLDRRLAVLEGYRGLLGELAGFEGGVAGQLAGLRAGVTGLERAIEGERATLGRLVSLLGLAGLGALALENLADLARDPCRCLTGGPFSDLEDRVEALENAGH